MRRNGDATETVWLDKDQQRTWRAYLVGTTLLMERLDRELREQHRMSLPEYEILVRLSEAHGNRMRMAMLADSLSHSRSRVTHTVSRMEAAGLVVRDPCESDGRGVEAVLTEHGRVALDEAAPPAPRPRPLPSPGGAGASSTWATRRTSTPWDGCSTR